MPANDDYYPCEEEQVIFEEKAEKCKKKAYRKEEAYP
jgi:hypothetical protein